MAQDALEQLTLDEIVFIPAHQSPLKGSVPWANSQDRWDLVQSSIASFAAFSASDFELSSTSISYTIETAKHFASKHPNDELYWLIGADQAKQLSEWRSIDELSKRVEFGIFDRSNLEYEDPLRAIGVRYTKVRARRIDISSTEIRERLKGELPVNNFLPAPAFEIITTRKLYQ